MKRDMDLVREILLKLEAHPDGYAPHGFVVDGYSEDQVGYHVLLMGEAGLLLVKDVGSRGTRSPKAIPIRMKWEGHEFLDLAREPSRWKRALDQVKNTGSAMTIEIVRAILVGLSMKQAGLG